jgi:hypothetical protein
MNAIKNRRFFTKESFLRFIDSLRYHEDGILSADDDCCEDMERQGALIKKRGARLRIFSDGVEMDGRSLKLSGNSFHIMQCFRFADRVEEMVLAVSVWGDDLTKHETIRSAMKYLKKEAAKKGFQISFGYDSGFWEILY